MADLNIATFFLRSKLYPPTLPPDHVPRARLLNKLNRIGDFPLTLVSAPAGYGKTTLLSAYKEENGWPCAWVSLDDGDNDLIMFLGYVISALRSAFPKFGQQTLKYLQATNLPPMPDIIRYLVNEIDQLEQEFVLVMDDYQVIVESEIHHLLDQILQHPPHCLHLVICTRHDPPLYLSKLRASHRILEIRANELRFSAEETISFMRRILHEEPQERAVASFWEKTEGWPVGLRLATIALKKWGLADYEPAILQVDNHFVIDYLIHEVLSRQSPTIRKFLLQTSILDRFCTPLCAAVMGASSPGDTMLNAVQQQGLFIEPLDNQNTWHRFHHLFRQFLQHRLTEEFPAEEVAALHHRASAWLAENGFLESAISHALQAGDMKAAVTILTKNCHALMNEERWLFLESLLVKFSPAALYEEPGLLLVQAWLMLAKYQHAKLDLIIKRLESVMKTTTFTDDDEIFCQSSLHTFAAIRCNWASELEEAIHHGEQALAIAPQNWILERSFAWMHLVTATYQLYGLQVALDLVAENDKWIWLHPQGKQVRNQGPLCFMHWFAGDLPDLRKVAENALKIAQELDLPESPSWFSYFVGCAAYYENKLEIAEQHFQSVVDHPFLAHPQSALMSTIGLARIYQARNQPEKAWKMSESAGQFCRDMNYDELLIYVHAFQAELAWQQGNKRPARHWLSQKEKLKFPALMPFHFQPAMTLPKLLIAEDTPKSRRQAQVELDRLHQHVTTTRNIPYLIEVWAMKALLQQREGNETAADEALQEALALARPGGFIRIFADFGPSLLLLLNRLAGQKFAPNYIREIISAFSVSKSPAANGMAELVESLTNREMDVLLLLAERLTNKEIADALVISPATVKRHTVNIYQKLNASNRRQAVSIATERGLIVPA